MYDHIHNESTLKQCHFKASAKESFTAAWFQKNVKITKNILHNQRIFFFNFSHRYNSIFTRVQIRFSLKYFNTVSDQMEKTEKFIHFANTTLPVSRSTLTWLPWEHLLDATLLKNFCLFVCFMFICCRRTPLKVLCNSGMVRHFFKNMLLRQSYTWAGEGEGQHSQGGVSVSSTVLKMRLFPYELYISNNMTCSFFG